MSEIPKSRINITLELELNGHKQRKELPLKLLFLGDFSLGSHQDPLSTRQTYPVHKNNIDDIVALFKPTLKFTVANSIDCHQKTLPISLKFYKIRDFYPESVALQIPTIRNLIAKRNLLKDLRAIIMDNNDFRTKLKSLLQTESNKNATIQYLQKCSPINKYSDLERV